MKNRNMVIKKGVIPNLIWNLQRFSLMLRLQNSVCGRSRIKCGMTSLYNSGFTLIELLVVVLIIGILAAVALPQYQRAVGKARAVEAKTVLSAYMKALHLAHLETGKNIPGDADLDIEKPVSQYWEFQNECFSDDGYWGCSTEASGKNQMQGVFIYLHDEGYVKAGGSSVVGFACTGEKCPSVGFTKYDVTIDTYFEP